MCVDSADGSSEVDILSRAQGLFMVNLSGNSYGWNSGVREERTGEEKKKSRGAGSGSGSPALVRVKKNLH